MIAHADIELFDSDGYHMARGIEKASEDKRTITVTASELKGSIPLLESILSDDMGKKVIIRK